MNNIKGLIRGTLSASLQNRVTKYKFLEVISVAEINLFKTCKT